MGTVNVGGSATQTNPQANTQNTGVAQTTSPGVFNSASSINFLNSNTNNSPAVVSNAYSYKKLNDLNQQFDSLAQPYLPKQDMNGNPQGDGMFGVDQETINNFKMANPGQDFTYEEAQYAKQANDEQKMPYTTPEGIYAMSGIDDLQKNSDSITSQYLDYIKESYKQMQEEQRQSNVKAENNARLALGVMGGSRSPTDNNSYIQETINQGESKLRKIALEEKGVVLEALKAKKDEDFKLFSEKVKQLDVIRNAKIEEAKNFNEKIQAQAEKMREEQRQAEKEMVISDMYSKGVTDVAEIVKNARNRGIPVTTKEASDVVGLLSGFGGTGIIAEYNYYKAEAKRAGITPVDFSTYQNQDANRKAIATGLGGVGTTGKTYSQAQGKYIDKVNMDVSKNATYTKTNNMKNFVQTVLTALSQENGISDIAAINQFQKIIDEGAVTRDQDVVLLQGAQSLANSLALKVDKLKSGDQLSPDQREQMKTLINSIYSAQLNALEKDPYISSVKKGLERNGIDEADTIISELDGFGNSTTNSLIENEQQAEIDFKSLKNNPPEIQLEISKRYQDLEQILGRPPTASEYFEANPWDRPKKVSSSVTIPEKGIVLGINIKPYATDPQHEVKIASIVQKVPDSYNALDYDKYIKSIAPKSPITGQMVLNASTTYGVSPRLVTAIIQNDSSFGTKGHGAKNNNPGNIGQFDELKGTVKGYKSLQEGVNAVAKWLATHKVNENNLA